MASRRTSRRTVRTFAGRVVYDRKPHQFKIKDVIRIAKKADYSYFPPALLTELVSATFTLVANAYGTSFIYSVKRAEALWALFSAIKTLIGAIGTYAVFYGIEVFDEFVKFLLLNFNIIKPDEPK